MVTSPSAYTETVIRRPRGEWLGGIFGAALIGVLGLAMLTFGILLLIGGAPGIALLLAVISAVMLTLFHHVLTDALAKRAWQIARVGSETLELRLPRHRSLTHSLKPVHRRLEFNDIAAIETRLEAFRSFGMANMQRSFALRLTTGELIILGEDRALGTGMATSFMADAVDTVASFGGLEQRDLGTVQGQGGVLSVLLTSVPPWDAPAVDAERQAALWTRARWTGRLALYVSLAVLITAAVRLFL